ncbi:2OG-Fe(II)oxygenase superfamily protein [Colletotrichum scovillei]|uniref:Leucoanthocyanidin dioxygenase n=1 Tax=Colletotrichum scovillei TaxID=1209932 RepID=A0A9P7U6Q2_9PEZI|nr:2OG-Fe(II)oxygenase superfamily protein [Colletotrichum scovillei]KAF4784463.1 2OG-Fe(II)oxygenase superfamily protein [Colletotrichum scovillei]KAG7044336.1 leucoanthocyanidin dioxygenase [Colletotrichum scovillei]KAG7049044.1 leucoanthocyanidin dioxygenase [Colletotrichum scovillei]KAG7063788.1 leucoanthocyanidin dioxygenase [Colletotrichum scovillei]
MAQRTRYVHRRIPEISLRDFDSRIDEITSQLCDAAENVGFFSIKDHGLSQSEVDRMFSVSESFFALPDEAKATVPWSPKNVGWEKLSQIRPSTGAADQKESYQLQFGENMNGVWASDEILPGFKEKSLTFMHRVQAISERLMLCLARGLGFEDDYFIKYHDAARPGAQSVLRLLHYYETPRVNDGKVYHRAGAHADWGFLTLLFQREGQSGLEICPGREAVSEHALGDEWTKVEIKPGVIICNIGDLLMSWSDDRFKSTHHRVKAPCEEGDFYGERYSMAFFNQPCKEAVIQGPLKKYPMVTGEEFNRNAMNRMYAALQAKMAGNEVKT